MNLKAYHNKNNAQTVEAFRLELFKETGVEETQENIDLYQRAWKHGYEGGFEEVYFHFVDLLDMMQDASGQI
ncbi:MAG: hypothetical protein HC840_00425 [Leptolyngbyaceae cyanobacterium RM2_2_4]|nr:hypothetical protein [Leptolyngbyaceae cyanobacterium RM2_2_4]